MSTYGGYIKSMIRTARDWPQPGVNFRNITPILQHKSAFRKLIDSFVHRYHDMELDVVAAVDARGFLVRRPRVAVSGRRRSAASYRAARRTRAGRRD